MVSRFSITTLALAALILSFASFAHAATGTVTNAQPFAWSNNSGWVNWDAPNGNVSITNSNLTGYIWAANHGWINLAPINSGVLNNGSGILSGYAWGQSTGWINFSGVTINPTTGVFHGQTVTQPIFGTMTFDCTNCLVKTDWVATAAYAQGGYGGGGPPSNYGVVNTSYAQSSYTPTNSPAPSYSEASYVPQTPRTGYAEGSYQPSRQQAVSLPIPATPEAISYNFLGTTEVPERTEPHFTLYASSQKSLKGIAAITYTVTNAAGQVVYSSKVSGDVAQGIDLSLPLKNSSPGTYILTAEILFNSQNVQRASQTFTIVAAQPVPRSEPQIAARQTPSPQLSSCPFDPILDYFPAFLRLCWLPLFLIFLLVLILIVGALYIRNRHRP